MSYPNVRIGFREWLTRTGSPLLSVVSAGNVRWGQLVGFKNTTSAICLSRSGGPQNPYRAEDEATIVARCYGGTANIADAATVAEAFKARVQAANYNTPVTGGVIEETSVSGDSDSHDPDLEQCPVVIVLVQVAMRAA